MENPPSSNQESNTINLIEYKVVICGDSCVGKTSILVRFLHNSFSDIQFSTISSQGYIKEIDLQNGKPPVRLSIWDTAGQEQYNSLVKVFFRAAAAVILVFDITNEKSFISLEKWHDLAYSCCPSETIFYIVGNKIDFPEEQQVVDCMKASRMQENLGAAAYFTVSAKSGEGVSELFHTVARDVSKLNTGISPSLEIKEDEKKKCC